jgi:dethiobiotin synthetase
LCEKADVLVVEGAGGWLAPLNNDEDIADLAVALNIPVIMVVAIRLGCINQARQTFQAIEKSDVECIGWLAVCSDPMMNQRVENIETIKNKITVPLLGVIPYAEKLDFNRLAENIIEKKLI